MTSYVRSSMTIDNISDEDYLVLRAKQAQKHDISEAKAWLITARTLFPKNFKIQFEAYSMHKNSGNIVEAARNLELMFHNFKNEDLLWHEVRTITDSLRSEVMDANSKFLKELYSKLSIDVQRGLLLTAAEKTEDMIEHCKMLKMLLQRFPECTSQHGMVLVENLLIAEKHAYSNSPVNNLRKLLVADILPLVLKAPSVDISRKQLYRLLHKSIEFCVYSIMKPYGLEDSKATGTSAGRGVVDSVWQELVVILELTGQKIGWELQEIFKTNDWEAQWQRLKTVYHLRLSTLDNPSSPMYRQVLYCATILFLRGFCEYVSIVDPNHLDGPVSERGCSAVLVEGLRTFSKSADGLPKYKKSKFDSDGKDDNMPDLAVSSQLGQTSGYLVRSFLIAVRCWDLLHGTEALATDFLQLSQKLLIDSWPCFQSFQIDVLIYRGVFSEAVQWLSSLPIPKAPGYMEKFLLQAACCYHQLGDHMTACSKAMDVVNSMSEKSPSSSNFVGNVAILNKPARHLVFLSLTMADVLHFCIKLLISRLKEIALNASFPNDIALGHLLVLLQYDWPQEESLFLDIIEYIKRRGTFSYNIFFNYVINVDMLEEFAHLSLPIGGSLTFNLLPSQTALSSKQRAITRGVNKGAKEDFRAAIEKQVSRCGENVLPLLVQFLTNERETLFESAPHV